MKKNTQAEGFIQKLFAEQMRFYMITTSPDVRQFSITHMRTLESKIIAAVKKAADYDGDVYTKQLIGEHFDRRDRK